MAVLLKHNIRMRIVYFKFLRVYSANPVEYCSLSVYFVAQKHFVFVIHFIEKPIVRLAPVCFHTSVGHTLSFRSFVQCTHTTPVSQQSYFNTKVTPVHDDRVAEICECSKKCIKNKNLGQIYSIIYLPTYRRNHNTISIHISTTVIFMSTAI